jgi:translation initiation factor IF-2
VAAEAGLPGGGGGAWPAGGAGTEGSDGGGSARGRAAAAEAGLPGGGWPVAGGRGGGWPAGGAGTAGSDGAGGQGAAARERPGEERKKEKKKGADRFLTFNFRRLTPAAENKH